MGETTKIPWCDKTFNCWIGCQKVSPGCQNCYAEARSVRFKESHLWGKDGKRRRTSKANWNLPHKWNRQAEAKGIRYKVFCASLADVFDNKVPQEWRDDLWALIKATPHLDWIIVTKRISNAKKMLPADWGVGYPNVWLLITVVNQEEAHRDIPKLLNVFAAIRGLSIEPQLGDIDFSYPDFPRGTIIDPWLSCLDWVISGAESGPNHRPYSEAWARGLRDQCQEANTAFFYKQRIVDGKKIETPELDGKRWMEFPA